MATYFVSNTGNNTTGTGTLINPWATIAKGITALNPGDTLFIRGGTYLEGIHLNTLGLANQYITISGFQTEPAIVRPQVVDDYPLGASVKQYHIYQNLIIDGTDSVRSVVNTATQGHASIILGANDKVPDASHDVIFQNNELKNLKGVAIYIAAQGPISVLNNLVHDTLVDNTPGNRFLAMYVAHGANFLIDGNEFYNCAGGGLQIYPAVSNVTIRGNSIHHNNTESTSPVGGIEVEQDTTLGPAMSGIQIYNNLIYSNGTSTSGNAYGIKVENVNNTLIYNNTIYNNKHAGIGVGAAQFVSTGVIIQNNIVYLNDWADGGVNQIFVFPGSTTTQDHNLTANPSFVNAAASDFHLQAGSVAIDTGTAIALVTNDYDKNTRPQGPAYDIGAYEFVVATDTTPPATPTGLQVI